MTTRDSDIIAMSDGQLKILKAQIYLYSAPKAFANSLRMGYSTFQQLINGYIPIKRARLEQIRELLEEAKSDFLMRGKKLEQAFDWNSLLVAIYDNDDITADEPV